MKKEYIKLIVVALLAFGGGKFTPDFNSYDANDGIYKFIPQAPQEWRDMFGDDERTRLIHSISELRVVVQNQGAVLSTLIDPNKVKIDDKVMNYSGDNVEFILKDGQNMDFMTYGVWTGALKLESFDKTWKSEPNLFDSKVVIDNANYQYSNIATIDGNNNSMIAGKKYRFIMANYISGECKYDLSIR